MAGDTPECVLTLWGWQSPGDKCDSHVDLRSVAMEVWHEQNARTVFTKTKSLSR